MIVVNITDLLQAHLHLFLHLLVHLAPLHEDLYFLLEVALIPVALGVEAGLFGVGGSVVIDAVPLGLAVEV